MAAVPPTVPPRQHPPKYRITPQERFEGYLALQDAQSAGSGQVFAARTVPGRGAQANAAPSGVHATVDQQPVFTAVELTYPGDRVEPVVHKWLYLLEASSGRIVAEAYALEANRWAYRLNPELAVSANLDLNDGLPAIRIPEATSDDYGFLLSPVRLTPEGAAALTQFGERTVPAPIVRVRRLAGAGAAPGAAFAAVPDPFRWAEEAHRRYYLEHLAQWRNWHNEPDRVGQLLIASTLKDWLQKQLIESRWLKPGQPSNWLHDFRTQESALRLRHEMAAAYLAACVMAPEHRAVDLSLQGAYLENGLLHYATVCRYLLESEPGRALLAALAADGALFPLRHFLTNPLPSELGQAIRTSRRTFKASVGLLLDFTPALLRVWLHEQGRTLPPHPDVTEALRDLFETVASEPERSRSLTFINQWASDSRLKNLAERLEQSPLSGGARIWQVVFDLAVLYLASHSLSTASSAERSRFAVEFFRAYASTVASAIRVETIAESVGASSRIGPVAGMVAGGIQMVTSASDAYDSVRRGDGGVAVGRVFEAAGGWYAVLAGALSLGATFVAEGSLLGPIGAICGIVAAVLTLAGGLLVYLFTTTEFEEYAKHCFLGEDSAGRPNPLRWSPDPLPGSTQNQIRALFALLSNFTVQWAFVEELRRLNLPVSYQQIQIDVGHFGAAIRLEVVREHPGYRSFFTITSQGAFTDSIGGSNPRPGRLGLPPEDGRSRPAVSRQNGAVTRIIVDTHNAQRCLVRLAPFYSTPGAHGFTIPIPHGTYVVIETGHSGVIRSTDNLHWEQVRTE